MAPNSSGGVNNRAAVSYQRLQCRGIVQIAGYQCDTEGGQGAGFIRVADQCSHLEATL